MYYSKWKFHLQLWAWFINILMPFLASLTDAKGTEGRHEPLACKRLLCWAELPLKKLWVQGLPQSRAYARVGVLDERGGVDGLDLYAGHCAQLWWLLPAIATRVQILGAPRAILACVGGCSSPHKGLNRRELKPPPPSSFTGTCNSEGKNPMFHTQTWNNGHTLHFWLELKKCPAL